MSFIFKIKQHFIVDILYLKSDVMKQQDEGNRGNQVHRENVSWKNSFAYLSRFFMELSMEGKIVWMVKSGWNLG